MNGFQDNSQSWLLAMKMELKECIEEKSNYYDFNFEKGFPSEKSSWVAEKKLTGGNLNFCRPHFVKN